MFENNLISLTLIGTYDSSTKIYTKSKGAEVSAYLEKALKLLEKLEDE